jgi:2-hydroxychromene-2-carboxylate isomerase
LHEDVERAIAAGVFGAPTFVVGREMFWGVDRLPMVERWIVNGGW